jgi:hypothetical protein
MRGIILNGSANDFDDRVTIGDEPRNVGFVFRTGRDQLTLFFSSGGRMEGSFKGEHTGGSLEEKQEKQLERWKAKYAQPELAIKMRSNQSMKPTAPLRDNLILFATTPCRGLSFSR